MSPTGGVLQGDDLTVEVTAESGARARITTQSATRVYRTPDRAARQRVRLHARDGAYLEYLPHPLILYADSRFDQAIEVTVTGGAVVVLTETVVPGRLARGERYAFASYRLRTDAAVDGMPVLTESGTVCPVDGMAGPAVAGAGPVWGALSVLGADTAELADDLHRAVDGRPDVVGGASPLCRRAGAVARVAAADRAACQTALRDAWRIARQRLVGPPRAAAWTSTGAV